MNDFWREFLESEAYIDNAKYRVIQGKAPHLESYWVNKLNGKPVEHHEVTGAEGGPVLVKFVDA